METAIYKMLQSVIDKALFLEKRSIFEYKETKLFPSEMHLIFAIHEAGDQAKNATRIAEQLGVTKGAISQTLTRLKKKRILSTTADPSNKNEITFIFTKFGRETLEQLLKWRDKLHLGKVMSLQNFSETERKAILRFLKILEETLSQAMH